MKFIRTQRGHEAVTLPKHGGKGDESVLINKHPAEVPNDAADAYVKAAALVGVALTVTDDEDTDTAATGVVSVDPAAGVVAATGTGDPVTTTGTTTAPGKPAAGADKEK